MLELNGENIHYFNFRKLIIFGEESSGKTSMVNYFKEKDFDVNVSHTKEDVLNHQILLKPHTDFLSNLPLNITEIRITPFILNITILKSLLYNCECALFLIDIDNADSFIHIKELIELIATLSLPYLTCILVVNKIDKDSTRLITNYEINQFASEKNVNIANISLLSSLYLDDFKLMIFKAYDNKGLFKLSNRYVFEEQQANNLNSEVMSFKVILIGNTDVGKTCFFKRFTDNTFTEKGLSTLGIDNKIKMLKVMYDYYKIQLWDTAGQERFRKIPQNFYKNSDGILLFFDINLKQSFVEILKWIHDIQLNCNVWDNKDNDDENNIIGFLIGNKVDKNQREVQREEAEELAQKYNLKYYETSCKWNLNIHEVILNMILSCYAKNKHRTIRSSSFSLNSQLHMKKKLCCGLQIIV